MERPTPGSANFSIPLAEGAKISLQAIYKALCKYGLSVVPSVELPKFKKTIDWLNGVHVSAELPLIAQRIAYQNFRLQPQLILYLRKDDDRRTPYAVGELQITCVTIVFVVPLCSEDDRTFVKEADHRQFWESFRHFSQWADWTFNDHSDALKRVLNLSLNISVDGHGDSDVRAPSAGSDVA